MFILSIILDSRQSGHWLPIIVSVRCEWDYKMTKLFVVEQLKRVVCNAKLLHEE